MISEKAVIDSENIYLQSPKAFHLEMPLYTAFDLTVRSVAERVFSNISYAGTIDAYCIYCEKESVFKTSEKIHIDAQWKGQFHKETELEAWMTRGHGYRRVVHTCTRGGHNYHAYYFHSKDRLIKFGQLPSAADFQIPQAEKYRKILGEQQYKELTRGIGLAAHGVGIGSYVYLRRIFEKQIEEARAAALGTVDEDAYTRARMDEKIQLLADYLPEFLVENKALYSILSKGIHELSEEECRRHFEAIKIGIEQILDERIEKAEKQAKAERARKAIQGVSQEVSKESEVTE